MTSNQASRGGRHLCDRRAAIIVLLLFGLISGIGHARAQTTVSAPSPGGSYDITQTVFELSILSNVVHGQPGTAASLGAALSSALNNAFRDYKDQMGPWHVVWGPAIFQSTEKNRKCRNNPEGAKYADHAMYVAYNSTINYYVVAIAGTNECSVYDRLLDVLVGKMVAFTAGGRPAGNVSSGTWTGIGNLRGMPDPSSQQPLKAFLDGKAGPGATLVFTGHSLGGALAPALAFYLYPTRGRWQNVYVVPTAGPSPGDEAFKDAFSASFPTVVVSGVKNPAYGFWNAMIWNQFDIVAHAWANLMRVEPAGVENDVIWNVTTKPGTLGIASANSLYGILTSDSIKPPPPAPEHPNCADEVFLASLVPGTKKYVRLGNQSFSPPKQKPNVNATITCADLLNDIDYQHVSAYFDFFDVAIIRAMKLGISLLSVSSVRGKR
jgi:hypothetical protein